MSEPFVGSEMNEELESNEQLEASARELTEITNEPGSYIEGRIEADHSEAIETSFTELANNQIKESGEIQMPACDGSSRPTREAGQEEVESEVIGTLPLPLPIDPPEKVNEVSIPVIEVRVTGQIPVHYDGGTASIAESGNLASIDPDPIFMDPDPFSSESASGRSDPDEEIGLIGENG